MAHQAAKQAWTRLLENTEPLLTTSYVVVETYALVQSRFGLDAVRTLGGSLERPRAERASPAGNRSPPSSDQRERPSEKWRATKADIFPMVGVIWVDEEVHHGALTALLAAQRRGLSLVDCASFVAMRRAGITRAFAFDRHFGQHGFEPVA